jgi:hypothetical protein
VNAVVRTDVAATPVLPATSAGTTEDQDERPLSAQAPSGNGPTENGATPSSTDTRNASESESLTSVNSAPRASVSNRHWQKPRNVRQFVSQVNDIATAILNGDLTDEQLERVRIYAGLTRVVAQGMTTEVQRARFLKAAPDLTFEDDVA